MELDRLLKLVVEKGASDLFITAGRPPSIKAGNPEYPINPPQVRVPIKGPAPCGTEVIRERVTT